MPRLIYFTNMSLDGYTADRDGNFGWTEPDEEQHVFINDLVRPAAGHLLGRRMYEVMSWWEDPANYAGGPPYVHDFGEIWRATDKVVYSRTLDAVTTGRTRLERDFDAAAVSEMKAASSGDLFVGGPELASHALRAGLVDEIILFVAPVTVGGGNAAMPTDQQVNLSLLEERRFGGGKIYLRYAVTI